MGRPFVCGRLGIAHPAGKAQSSPTWRVWRFKAPQEYKFPIGIVPKLMGMSGAPWSKNVGGPLTKVLQHSALHLQVGADVLLRRHGVRSAATHLSPRQGWRSETTTVLTGLERKRRSWTDLRGAMRCRRTFPLAAPSWTAKRSAGFRDQLIGRNGSECSRTRVPRL